MKESLGRSLPDGWALLRGDRDPKKEAQQVADFFPLLPEWNKDMRVARRWNEFSEAQWKAAVTSAEALPTPKDTLIRILDEARLLQGDVLYRLSLARYHGTEKHPSNFNLSIQIFYPKNWYYRDQSDSPGFLRPGEILDYQSREYIPENNIDFGTGRIVLPTTPFDIEKQREFLKTNARLRQIMSLDREEYFSDEFEKDIDERLQRAQSEKDRISFTKDIDISWEEFKDAAFIQRTIGPMITNIEALLTEFISQNSSEDSVSRVSVATLGATVGRDDYLSQESINTFFEKRTGVSQKSTEDIDLSNNDIVSLDERRKTPVIHSNPEYWGAQWQKEIDSFVQSGFEQPQQHPTSGPMLLRFAERAFSNIVQDGTIRHVNTSGRAWFEKDFIIPLKRIRNLDKSWSLQIAGEDMNSSTNYPHSQDTKEGEVFFMPILDMNDPVTLSWSRAAPILLKSGADTVRVRLAMTFDQKTDFPKAFMKLARYNAKLLSEATS